MNLSNRTIHCLAEENAKLKAALETVLRTGQIRAWDHETTSPALRKLMRTAREALGLPHEKANQP